jgi:hypothetical protein
MELQEVSPGQYCWVSASSKKEKKPFFLDNNLSIISRFIKKRQYTKLYYEKITRKRFGITKRTRKTRKKWKTKTPANVVPVV